MQEDRLPPGARRTARDSGPTHYSESELRLRLSRSRSGDVEVRNELHDYFRGDIAAVIAYYPFTVLEDASSEASLELLEVLVTHEPAPDEDPHRAVTRAVCRKLKNRLERQLRRSGREVPWSVVSPETSYDDVASGVGARETGDRTFHDIFDQICQPDSLELDVVNRVTLWGALDRLSERDWAVIHLHVVQERPFEAVSAVTGAGSAACRKRFERSRDRLSRDLGESFPEVGADRPDGKGHR
jgi:DNA-directed RNA polymerase specialized sigma24 family protein